MLYSCKICKDINIKHKHNMNTHINSQKHIDKLRQVEKFKNIRNLSKEENKIKIMCKICGNLFKSDKNLEKHLDIHTKKYTQYKCENCDSLFSSKSNYTKHNKNLCKTTINNTRDKNLNKNKKDDSVIPIIQRIFDSNFKKLETNLEYKIKESIDNSALNTKVTTAINTAASLIKYLMKTSINAPPVEKLKQNKCLELLNLSKNIINNDEPTDSIDINLLDNTLLYNNHDNDYDNDTDTDNEYDNKDDTIRQNVDDKNKYKLEKELINEYVNGTFISYLSDIIANIVKKNDPREQSIWNTDSNRLNYVIKTSVDKWSEDKSAVKFIDLVIKPFLIQIKKLLINYRNDIVLDHLKLSRESQRETRMEYMNILQPIIDFETIIMSETKIIKPIVKTLSPILRFNNP